MGKLLLSCLTLLTIAVIGYAQESNDPNENGDSTLNSQNTNVVYSTPIVEGQFLYESFDDKSQFESKWIKSTTHKADSSELKYDGEWDTVQTQPGLKGNFSIFR